MPKLDTGYSRAWESDLSHFSYGDVVDSFSHNQGDLLQARGAMRQRKYLLTSTQNELEI